MSVKVFPERMLHDGQMIQKIDFEAYMNVLAESEVHEALDLGLVSILRVTHPELGHLALVNTTGSDHGLIQL